MKFDPVKACAQAEIAKLAALYGPPLSEDERREHDRLVVREIARHEARQSPQIEFPEA